MPSPQQLNNGVLIKLRQINKAFEPSDWHALSGIVLSGADSMKARKEVFEAWLKSPSATHLIDTRMSIEYLAVYVISKDHKKDVADYTKTSNSDICEVHICTPRVQHLYYLHQSRRSVCIW